LALINLRAGTYNINVNCVNLHAYDKELYEWLLRYPQDIIPAFDLVRWFYLRPRSCFPRLREKLTFVSIDLPVPSAGLAGLVSLLSGCVCFAAANVHARTNPKLPSADFGCVLRVPRRLLRW
jgi:hypothetical protein